jgi:hypothetical protein
MTIYFDMDGTIADLYGVENWLPKLRNSDPSPYTDAKPLLHFSTLARLLNAAQRSGINIGIISWTSKGGSATYNQDVMEAKRKWLRKHLPSVRFNEIHIVPYGYPKELFATDGDILFDDCEAVRRDWTGEAYTPEVIFEILRDLV